MSKFTVLVTALHLTAEAQAILRDAGAEIVFMPEPINEETLVAQLQAAPIHAILLRGSKPITARVLAASSHLKLVAKNGAGVDSVDLDAAKQLGIAVRVASGANADAVAEHAIAMMLALTRNLAVLDAKVKSGGWEGTSYQGRDFRGSVVGIVGYGAIGKSTANLARALGARVLMHRLSNPAGTADDFEIESSFEKLLTRVDILSLHCPLTEQTRGLVGRSQLQSMKQGSLLINTARGGIVDEAALAEALTDGAYKRLAGAGLDTFAHEPIEPDHPLLKMSNVILTPHVAGVTAQAALAVSTITARNITEFFI
jgi:D-3-phosphoglycerate dehydrogenase / 2-oxoglutarate reductase